ncbi:hypothetical protein H5410_033519 [Solanum commersonii]|uniref:Uncharacterized protein n=1 Tax=Solanum commersonii TaxID=4109 RepID=A0A9J5YQF4_SOLCO|nr:hypothetical protein H5410_033519 [Solanum commersonii]
MTWLSLGTTEYRVSFFEVSSIRAYRAYLPKSKAKQEEEPLRNSEDSGDYDEKFPRAAQEAQDDLKEDGPPNGFHIGNLMLQSTWSMISQDINIESTTETTIRIALFNEFWSLRDKLITINDTITEVPLRSTGESHKHDKMAAYSYRWTNPSKFIVVMSVFGRKSALPGVTMIVSRMHSLFDFDIREW